MTVLARLPSPARERPPGNRPLLVATAVVAGCLVAVGLAGTLSMRHFGRVPFSVPSWPWYHSWPFYLFWQPTVDASAALEATEAMARAFRVNVAGKAPLEAALLVAVTLRSRPIYDLLADRAARTERADTARE